MQFLTTNSWSRRFVLRDTSCVSRVIITCTYVINILNTIILKMEFFHTFLLTSTRVQVECKFCESNGKILYFEIHFVR